MACATLLFGPLPAAAAPSGANAHNTRLGKKAVAPRGQKAQRVHKAYKANKAYQPQKAHRPSARQPSPHKKNRPVPRAKASLAAPRLVSVGHRAGLQHTPSELALQSSAALVVDSSTGEELLAKNAQAVLPIASITKLMTALVVIDSQRPMNEILRIHSVDVDRVKRSSSRLAVGTRLSRHDMLRLALMSSENRAAHALARSHPGGVPAFVAAMNAKARQLGMRSSHFAGPSGLQPQNRSTARDLARLVQAADQEPMIRELSTLKSHTVTVGRRQLLYRNTNRLIHRDDWSIALQKTGYINEAGKCVVMQTELDGRDLVLVLLDGAGPAVRVQDAERIRRWLGNQASELVGGDSETPTDAARDGGQPPDVKATTKTGTETTAGI